MKTANHSLIFALLVGLPMVGSTAASAKGVTTRITLTDVHEGRSVSITDPKILGDFNVWSGPGTFMGGVEGSDGFIIDWRSEKVTQRPTTLRQFEVSFYTGAISGPTSPEYVVLYEFDPASQLGYVYLPGKSDKWYSANVRTIFRGNEGNWFRASEAWQRIVGPLVLAPAAAQQPTAIACFHGANESTEQRDRRTAAIRVARMINSAEANGRTPYRPLAMLNVPVPEAWEARLVTDGSSYSFSVKDRLDPCQFTLFSDDTGVIYLGEAMR
jgi:hypothetical protein